MTKWQDLAGFIGEHDTWGTNQLVNCVFDGSIVCSVANDHCAGFVYKNNSSKEDLVMTNCVFNPTELKNCSGQNFVRDGNATLSDSYATLNLNAPGTQPVYYDSQGRVIIRSAADWEAFRNLVATAKGNNVDAVLLEDIITNTMIGTNDENKYYGTFDGNGHTIDYVNTTYVEYAAPFTHVGTCTIKNLHVTGNVATKSYSSALIGRCENNSSKTVTIENCRVSNRFDLTAAEEYRSAFVGQANAAKVIMRNNLFDGEATCKLSTSGKMLGVFIGYGYKDGTDVFEHNLDNGTYNFYGAIADPEVASCFDSQGNGASPAGTMKNIGMSTADPAADAVPGRLFQK